VLPSDNDNSQGAFCIPHKQTQWFTLFHSRRTHNIKGKFESAVSGCKKQRHYKRIYRTGITDCPKIGSMQFGMYSSRFLISTLPSLMLIKGSAYKTPRRFNSRPTVYSFAVKHVTEVRVSDVT